MDKKFTDAKCQLIFDKPFFGTLVSYLVPTPTDNIDQTAVSSRGHLYYNPKYVESLSVAELQVVMAHEVLHLALDVFGRLGNRNRTIWNIAHDYAINWILYEAGMIIPPEWYLDSRFSSMSADEIYNSLMSELNEDDIENLEKSHIECVSGDHNQSSEIQEYKLDNGVSEQDPDWNSILKTSYVITDGIGSLPGQLLLKINSVKSRKITWDSILQEFVTSCVYDRSDFTWERPDRRETNSKDIIMPAMSGVSNDIVVCIDVSGSVLKSELVRFLAETESLLETICSEVKIFTVDTKIHNELQTSCINDVVKQLKGGGGTDFTSVFKTLDSSYPKPSCVIFFTDLHAKGIPSISPEYPLLWVAPTEHGDIPKSGRTIIMKD